MIGVEGSSARGVARGVALGSLLLGRLLQQKEDDGGDDDGERGDVSGGEIKDDEAYLES